MKRGYWLSAWNEFRKNRLAFAALLVVCVIFTIALLGNLITNSRPYVYVNEKGHVYFPLFYDYPELRNVDLRKDECRGFKLFPPIPYSYSEYDLDSIVTAPSSKHIMGTDEQGRDLASRMVLGTRVSIVVGFVAVAIYVSIGIFVGAIAGYYGGRVDFIISRIIEIVICFPTFS